ncbi:hypothetical protein N7509_004792 [Penicillium cosmopolitanum]|uniref:Protein kinase domain-containing protein n=1 Tax=Penicillium cosmopolitanum TaxID=1131564 RepID=A0A9X0B9H8_9EURO|nr:uncharacterized protein N7509_004792 [Penicillium cosmopolitanum]KAJ5396679.1 hypothetical protein N7509_004792 [Penicillium cosmopolitanum]
MQLSLHTGHDGKGILHTSTSGSSLTPPVTPIGKESSERIVTPLSETSDEHSAALFRRNITTPLRFTDELEPCLDERGRRIEFGEGVWSKVYKARSTPTTNPATTTNNNTLLNTPPSSPINASRVVAVKTSRRGDAGPVLKTEALILTRLTLTPGHENHIVPFHGFHAETQSLVMTAVPLALSTYIEEAANRVRNQPIATATMFDPFLGPEPWKDLARKLISSLGWLHHTAGIMHGDVKPHSILLRPIEVAEGRQDMTNGNGNGSNAFRYEPLLADFSAAMDISPDPAENGNEEKTLSSFTAPFSAPEVLKSLRPGSGNPPPGPASDVFSLAATLLAAATGDVLLYPGCDFRRRNLMAGEGHQILDFIRSFGNGARVPRNGFVERLVRQAVVKDPAKRITAIEWVGLAEEVCGDGEA